MIDYAPYNEIYDSKSFNALWVFMEWNRGSIQRRTHFLFVVV